MSVAREVVSAVRASRMRTRDAMYTIACALAPSQERSALLWLLGLAEYREGGRIAYAQATMDLTPHG